MSLPDYGVFTGVYDFFQRIIFGAPEGMYEHYVHMPGNQILELDRRFKQVLTTDCFYSDDYGYKPHYEYAVLDTKDRVVVFYAMSCNLLRGTLLNTWRISDSTYDVYIENIGYKYIRHSLNRMPVVLDTNLAHEGTHYWQGIVFSIMCEEPTARLIRRDRGFTEVKYPFNLEPDFLGMNNIQYILCVE